MPAPHHRQRDELARLRARQGCDILTANQEVRQVFPPFCCRGAGDRAVCSEIRNCGAPAATRWTITTERKPPIHTDGWRMNGAEFKNWLKSQGYFTRAALDRVTGREQLAAERDKLSGAVPSIAQPTRRGSRYFFSSGWPTKMSGSIHAGRT